MRTLILLFGMAFLIACSSQKKAQSDFSDDVRLTGTTATTLSSQSLLDVVLSWSCDFDSLDIVVEPPVDSCRPTAADAAAQPSRLHLRARHASVGNTASVKKAVRTDSMAVDTMAAHRTTHREEQTDSESSGVYKPPDFGMTLLILVLIFGLLIVIRHR